MNVTCSAKQMWRVLKVATASEKGMSYPLSMEVFQDGVIMRIQMGPDNMVACCLPISGVSEGASEEGVLVQIGSREVLRAFVNDHDTKEDPQVRVDINTETLKAELSMLLNGIPVMSPALNVQISEDHILFQQDFDNKVEDYDVALLTEDNGDVAAMIMSIKAAGYYCYWTMIEPGSVTELNSVRALVDAEKAIKHEGTTFMTTARRAAHAVTPVVPATPPAAPTSAPTAAPVTPTCVACNGTGKNTAGTDCPICAGTGAKVPRKAAAAISPPAPAPAPVALPTQPPPTPTVQTAPPAPLGTGTASTPPAPGTEAGGKKINRRTAEQKRLDDLQEALALLNKEVATPDMPARDALLAFCAKVSAAAKEPSDEPATLEEALNSAMFRLEGVREKLLAMKAMTTGLMTKEQFIAKMSQLAVNL